jgi:hypothetical protein
MYIYISILTENSILQHIFSPEEISNMLRYLVDTVVFTTATAVTWWFGDRAIQPRK